MHHSEKYEGGRDINWNKIDLLGVIDDTMKLRDISDISSFEMELIPYPIFEFYAKENWNEFAANDIPCLVVFSRWKMKKGEREWFLFLFPSKFYFLITKDLRIFESQSGSWYNKNTLWKK